MLTAFSVAERESDTSKPYIVLGAVAGVNSSAGVPAGFLLLRHNSITLKSHIGV